MNVVGSTASVSNFIVGRKGYGTISFKSPVDLTDIPSLTILREIVEIKRAIATVYPDQSKKPPTGKGLNVTAQVTLENVRPPPDFEEGDEYIEELRAMPDINFVLYSVETGLWVFTVENFSTYGLGWETSSSSSSGPSRSSSPITFQPGSSSARASSSSNPSSSAMSTISSRPPIRPSFFPLELPLVKQQLRSRTRNQRSEVTIPPAGGNPTAISSAGGDPNGTLPLFGQRTGSRKTVQDIGKGAERDWKTSESETNR